MRELKQLYARAPEGYLPAHNHVLHVSGMGHGYNGFRRFWIPTSWARSGKWRRCPCGWTDHGKSKWNMPGGRHFAHRDSVKNWEALIEKHGSLEAAHKHVARRIDRDNPRSTIRWAETKRSNSEPAHDR
jgi:hypothetical protein